MSNVMERLRAGNPEPGCDPPSIEIVWRRLESEREVAAGSASPDRTARLGVRRRTLGRLGLALASAVALGVAALAVALLAGGHSGSGGAPSVPQQRTGAPARRRAAPAGTVAPSVSAGAVATPLTLRMLAVGRYCNGEGMQLVACRPGQRPVNAHPERLVQLSLTARRSAEPHSWYAWDIEASACPQAGRAGATLEPVRAGARLTFDALIPAGCRGRLSASVSYVTQAPRADSEHETLVGRRTVRLP